jgi:hypothetical protein
MKTEQQIRERKATIDAERVKFGQWWAAQEQGMDRHRTEWERVVIQAAAWRGWIASKGLAT